MGYSPWGREESDTTEQFHFPFSLSCIGEGNGNPLQCSCLENPRDGGAWWAAVYGVAQSRTRLTQLREEPSGLWLDTNGKFGSWELKVKRTLYLTQITKDRKGLTLSISQSAESTRSPGSAQSPSLQNQRFWNQKETTKSKD